jgi:hypothetical protein
LLTGVFRIAVLIINNQHSKSSMEGSNHEKS